MTEIFTVDIDSLSVHDEALSTPRMSTEQFESLKASLDSYGQMEPAIVYRGKIVDGRHRWLALKELKADTIKITKMPNNSTLADIKIVVRAKETRRHETASQLAISAYNYILASKTNVTQDEASKIFGVPTKRIGEAKKIDTFYGRRDILDLLFNGGKFNTGTAHIPFLTDSLGTILRWLAEHGQVMSSEDKDIGISARVQLTEDEQVIINKYMAAIRKESLLVKDEVARMLYAEIKA